MRKSRSAAATTRRPARLRWTEPSASTAPCTHLSGRHVFLPGPPPPHPADHLGRPRLRRSLLARQRGRPHPEPRPARRERDEVRQRLRHRPDLLPLPLGAHRRRPPAALGGHWFDDSSFPPASQPVLPELLGAHGYRTGYFGKIHYGAEGPGDRACPEQHGFDSSFYGLTSTSSGRLHYLLHSREARERL